MRSLLDLGNLSAVLGQHLLGILQANPAFVAAIKAKTTDLEGNWAKAAEAKGLKDAKKVLAEYRAEIAKIEK